MMKANTSALSAMLLSKEKCSTTPLNTLKRLFAISAKGLRKQNNNMGNWLMLPLRGGNWGNLSAAGVCALNFNDTRLQSNQNLGFRAALPHSQIPPAYGPMVSA